MPGADGTASSRPLVLAVAAGKGGTGKTTVAVSLALSLGGTVRLLDCDVDAPDCHIFLKPEIRASETVEIPVPVVDAAKCTACGECARLCRFNALACLKTGVLVFEELCHGCGGCTMVCPEDVISETGREVGVIETGAAGEIEFVQGRLRVGEAMTAVLVHAVKRHVRETGVTVIDSPPGASCPMVAAVADADLVLLVAEPTPFGLNDLVIAVETVRLMGLPPAVVINRWDIGDSRVEDFCRQQDIPILLEVGEDRRIAEASSRGIPAIEALPLMREQFERLWEKIFNFQQDRDRRPRPVGRIS